jgi:hypothetical protein
VPLVDAVYARFLRYLKAGEFHRFKAVEEYLRLPGTSACAATFNCFRHTERPRSGCTAA